MATARAGLEGRQDSSTPHLACHVRQVRAQAFSRSGQWVMIDGLLIQENLTGSHLSCALRLQAIGLAAPRLGKGDRHNPSTGAKTQQHCVETRKQAMLLLPNKGSLNLEEKKSLDRNSQSTQAQAFRPFRGSSCHVQGRVHPGPHLSRVILVQSSVRALK